MSTNMSRSKSQAVYSFLPHMWVASRGDGSTIDLAGTQAGILKHLTSSWTEFRSQQIKVKVTVLS